MDFRGKDLRDAVFDHQNLSGSDFSKAYLTGASFKGAVLEDTLFDGANIARADFGGAFLDNSHLNETNAKEASFKNASLRDVEARGVKFNYAILNGTTLGGDFTLSDFSHAKLVGADCKRGIFRFARFDNAVLTGCDLRHADLADATGPIAYAKVGGYHLTAAGGLLSIGCLIYPYDEWLEDYQEIGLANDLSQEEIDRYIQVVRIVVNYLREEKNDN